jgi:hypothetical protein
MVKQESLWPTTIATLIFHLKSEHEQVVSTAWPLKELARVHRELHRTGEHGGAVLDHSHGVRP